ncbi:MAG: carboxymuconolactone decarboxylase family protein [Desulfobacterales bacterium]|nr:carboxymuconolactone decarboxylase family protein [Desulfobacterales bacterium]MDP3316657.1 carboxymuconolactone decarboxylase family protein [Devosia sp.]
MSRIPLLPQDTAEPRSVVDSLRARREGRLLNEADLTVLHAPHFARGWNELACSVRQELGLPARLRELAIISVGVLNQSAFEVAKHAPGFLKGGGTQAQLDALWQFDAALQNSALFDATDRAAMQLAKEMTLNVKVSDRTFREIERLLPSHERLVELVGTIAMYNMVTRFLVALEVEEG